MEIPPVLLSFDTDGIFQCLDYYSEEDKVWFKDEYISGPINPLLVRNNMPFAEKYSVSESPFYPKEPDGTPMFTLLNKEPSRYLNLLSSYNHYWDKYGQEPRVKLYISDNGDYHEAAKAEFTYIRHDLFLTQMRLLS